MSGDSNMGDLSDGLVLGDSEKGLNITGITDDVIAAKTGVTAEDQIVAATIQLDHLNKNEVMNILKVLEPYSDNMKVLTKKDLDQSAGLSFPEFGLSGSSNGIEKPEVKTGSLKYNAPKFKMPHFNLPRLKTTQPGLETPDVNLPASKIDVKSPDLEVNETKVHLNDPSVNVETPDVNIKGHAIKWPHQKWKGFKGAKLDADVSTPEASVPSLTTNGDLSTPDVNICIPDATIKEPELDVKTPHSDIDVHSGKINWPHLKWRKNKLDLKADQDLDANLNADTSVPDLEIINAMNVEVQNTTVDAEPPSGKINWPHLKWKKPKTPDAGLSTPTADCEITTPDVDLDSAKPKFKWPTLKRPKAKVNGPDIDASVAPNLNLSADPAHVELSAPDGDLILPKANLEEPKIDIKTPDVEGPSGKFKLFNLKKPKIGVQKDLSLPDADVSCSGPDLDLHSDGKLTGPRIRLPKLKGPKVKSPELDANLKAPNIDADNLEINTEGLSLSAPKADLGIDTTDTGIDLPKADLEFFKLPDLPTVDVSKPDFDVPDLSLSSPKVDGVTAPSADIKLPHGELEAPDLQLKDQNLDLSLPTADLKGPDEQIKLPDLEGDSKLLNFGLSSPEEDVNLSVGSGTEAPKVNLGSVTVDPTVSGPVLDESIKAPEVDVKAPNVDVNVEKSKLPHLKVPKFNFWGSSTKAPDTPETVEVSADVKGKDLSAEAEVSSPNVGAAAPGVTTSLSTPELDTTAEADAEPKDSHKNKLKWPFKWGIKSSSGTDDEGSGVDSETEVSNTEVEVPMFKFHQLPRNNIDSIGGIGDVFDSARIETEAKDYVVSKGIRLPILNVTSRAGEKINIMERLEMAKEKAPSPTVSPTEAKAESGLNFASPNVAITVSPEAGDSSLVREGTFKVEKPTSELEPPEILPTDENEKLSLSLTNMLGLNVKDSDAD